MYYFLNILEMLVLLTVSAISWIYRKNRDLDPIRFYLISSIIITVCMLFVPQNEDGRKYYYMLFNLGSMLDLCLLYYYFRQQVTEPSLRSGLAISYLTILGIFLYFWLGPIRGFTKFTAVLYGLENLFITIPCIVYFYSLFRSEEDIDLKTNPHFFVACAVLFFYGTTFPFYITYKTLFDITPGILVVLNSVNSFLTIILLLMFMKAFLCPSPEPK